ncbi:flagellar biosynthesis protein FlhB [Geothermobacter hydrogeniphilus]|uniref:Flagellar biosynthesis protein FlhB n=1 Tax=Geothermobacter hydrogeniphilus TaxID=1969733 RepID=A0A2K2HCZ7_9BACT|nr:EscU/YscU/HrcU family type III secretion system export apparatus switch protein [Geothermobacter hydrogeniphilus]PNU21172.1 flagellar biosynthesis protein FlhB [Geothermobacter hydrogeniphilus]
MDTVSAEDRAVALLYRKDHDRAPKVVAGGRGELARRIVQLAEESGVNIVSDPDLVELLSRVPTGDEIPLELYQAVAELLAFIYQVNQDHARNGQAEIATR